MLREIHVKMLALVTLQVLLYFRNVVLFMKIHLIYFVNGWKLIFYAKYVDF